jgi:large subunit ribosomal protein L25
MSELMKLKVEGRTEAGKGPSRRLREAGMVPGVYYDSKGHNIPIKVDFVALSKVVDAVGYSKVFELEIDRDGKSETMPCLIKDIHHHPLKPLYNHVDFFGVDLHKKVTVSIPVHVKGKAIGVTRGGDLGIFRETVEVECYPKDIPDSLVIDVTDLDLGHSIFIADVDFGEGVSAVYEENYAVVGVVAPRAAAEETEEEEAEEVAEVAPEE